MAGSSACCMAWLDFTSRGVRLSVSYCSAFSGLHYNNNAIAQSSSMNRAVPDTRIELPISVGMSALSNDLEPMSSP